jgi:hypothetical protein
MAKCVRGWRCVCVRVRECACVRHMFDSGVKKIGSPSNSTDIHLAHGLTLGGDEMEANMVHRSGPTAQSI